MSFIDRLIGHLGNVGVEQDALPQLVPAVIAAGALVAFADGKCDTDELREIDDKALHCLMGDARQAENIRRVINTHLSNYDRDLHFGHDRALAVLVDFAPDASADQRETVLHAALEVGEAGDAGSLTDAERETLREIARILKLDPAAHGF